MITKGLDIAAKGMMALLDMNDNVANNLANVNTAGYKKANLTFKSVYDSAVYEKTPPNSDFKYGEENKVGTLGMGPKTDKMILDFSQGYMSQTGNPLDVAINGDGFFKVQSVDGSNTAYTRNGAFTINNQNMLVTKDGDYVLDTKNKPIKIDLKALRIDTNRDLIIDERGQIQTNKPDSQQMLQQIGVYDFRVKSDMRSIGDSKFLPQNPSENPEVKAEKFSLQQGSMEYSNANTVNEMINIINVSRNYETLAKFVKTDGDLLEKAINLGRLQI